VCVSKRQFDITLPRQFRGLTSITLYSASRGSRVVPVVNGRVHISFVGIVSRNGPRIVAAAIWIRGHAVAARIYTLCARRDEGGVGQVNVAPSPVTSPG
jgi:hypothetical protein